MNARIIVLTHRRGPLLQKFLESIFTARQSSELHLEIICGINGSDPESAQLLARYVGPRAVPLRIHQLGEAQDPSPARQRLLEVMEGTAPDWFCFLDDDVVVPENYFEEFLSIVRQRPEIAVLGGPNLTPPEDGPFAELSGNVLASPLATGPFATRYRRQGRGFSSTSDVPFILCNLWIRADVFQELRFPTFTGGGEENDLLRNAFARGWKGHATPALWVWHHRRPNLRGFVLQIFKYGRGRGNILRTRRGKSAKFASLLVPATLLLTCVWIGWFGSGTFFIGYLLLMSLGASRAFGALPAHGKSTSLQGKAAGFLLAWGLFPLIHLSYGLGVLRGVWFPSSRPSQ